MIHPASYGRESRTVDRYRDGDLTDAERRSFEDHLRGCDFCRGRLDDGDVLGRLLRSRDEVLGSELPVDFTSRVMSSLPSRKHSVWSRWLSSWQSHRLLWVSAVAVAAALAVLVPLVVRQGAIDRRSAAENEAGLRKGELIRPPATQRRHAGGPPGIRPLPAPPRGGR